MHFLIRSKLAAAGGPKIRQTRGEMRSAVRASIAGPEVEKLDPFSMNFLLLYVFAET